MTSPLTRSPARWCSNTASTMPSLCLELLTEENLPQAQAVRREDISEDFVDSADAIWELTQWGLEHGCLGHTFLILWEGKCVGFLLLGEAIPWETDPPEMAEEPFYRLMGFVLDTRYRGRGIGGQALDMAIARCYQDFGPRPIALGVHKDNIGAQRFYLRHGFVKTRYMEGNDYYFLRYPPRWRSENDRRSG